MNSHRHAIGTSSEEASSPSPEGQRTNASTFSASRMRHSYASSETPESSTAASLRHSLLNNDGQETTSGASIEDAGTSRDNGKGSQRSHRSRSSGGFLLTNPAFSSPTRNVVPYKPTEPLRHDHKGKSSASSPEKRHKKRISNLGIGGSPLAGNVTSAGPQKQENAAKEGLATSSQAASAQASSILDVNSTQIVNLALNLSESRRNASRMMASGPLPAISGFAENMAGGSMRYHMQQQQRRSSRNVSPKPDRAVRNMSTSGRVPSGTRLNGSLPGFEAHGDGQFQYHFSASTLARAEKAKRALELMAQYRTVLQYIPPLKPQTRTRTATTSTQGSELGSPGSLNSYGRTYANYNQQQTLGRPYNPLQYIRNRKVRARLSKTIDGDALGFGDLSLVTSWVQKVSKAANSSEDQSADYLLLPPLEPNARSKDPEGSPQTNLARSNTAAKPKRPRIDWITDPADMLADLFWLEQEDHKKLIEDHYGRHIFPQKMDLRRPTSQQELPAPSQQTPNQPATPPQKEAPMDKPGQSDHHLPNFKSVRLENENFAEKGASRAREKLRHVRDAAKMHHHNGSGREVRQFLRSRSRSDVSTSDSDLEGQPRRKRSGTTDSQEAMGKDILAKQMAGMLEEETRLSDARAGLDHQGRRDAVAVGERDSFQRDGGRALDKASASHARSASSINHSKRNSLMNASSGRASLEVPGSNSRTSLDLDLDTTAPSSPDLRAGRMNNAHIPSISMDLTSSRSRPSSPHRALSKVRDKLRSHHDRNYPSDQSLVDEDSDSLAHNAQNDPLSGPSDRRRRSLSPTKRLAAKHVVEGPKQTNKADFGRRDRAEDSSGIRSFLKSARNPVNRVSGMIWRKDGSPGHASSGVSTDSSDIEDTVDEVSGTLSGVGKFNDLAEAHPSREQPSYLKDMPAFVSSSEGRERSSRAHDLDRTSNSVFDIQADRVRRRESPQPYPKIQIQSPASSPEFILPRWDRRASSNTESRRESFTNVQEADSRLNAVLNYPNPHRINGLPVTGLAGIDPSNRRPSMQGKRQWSISDQVVSVAHGPTTKREVARVRALRLSSGIKAKEISRRAAALVDIRQEKPLYSELVPFAQQDLFPVPKSQEHILASQILSDDIQLSAQLWQQSADTFSNSTVAELLSSIESLQSRVTANLTPKTREAADGADEVSKDLVTSQTLNVKRISDKIERMIRTRRRRFRWLRRGGWVMVEWALVGVMWYVWFLVVLCRILLGIGHGVIGSFRWLFFLD